VKAASEDLRRVCLSLSRRGDKPEAVAAITGLTPGEVERIIGKETNAAVTHELSNKDKSTNPCFRQTLRLLLPWTAEMMNHAVVRIEIVDNKRRLVGNFVEEKLMHIASKELRGPFSILSQVSLEGTLSARWLQLPS